MINKVQCANYNTAFTSRIIINDRTMRKITDSNRLLGTPLSDQLSTIANNSEKDVVFINMLKDKIRVEVCKSVDGKSMQGISCMPLNKKMVGFNLVEMYNTAVLNFKDLSGAYNFDMSKYF